MLTLRFFQAIGGGFATVICLATVRDVYPVVELGRRFATVTMVLARRAARRSGARRCGAPHGVGDDLRAEGGLWGRPARRVRQSRARDAARPARQSVAALRVPAVRRGRAAARRLAAPADSLCDRDGVLGVLHDDLRHQLVVHLHAVLRREPGAFLAVVRHERARLHVDEPVQHVAAQRGECGRVLPRRAHDPSARRRGPARR